MNFLAHCLLAARATGDHNHGLVAGGILGDFWKGAIPDGWPRALIDGVRLHRRIDAESNRHPAVKRSCDRFPPSLRRYAPILVDIHADLVLARQWPAHHPHELGDFATACYGSFATLGNLGLPLPADLLRFIDYMERRNLLCRYGDWDGVELCITGIGRRLDRPELTAPALEACRLLSNDLESDFVDYFPDLVRAAALFAATTAVKAG